MTLKEQIENISIIADNIDSMEIKGQQISKEVFTSIGDIRDRLNKLINLMISNGKDPYDIPLYIKNDYHKYPIHSIFANLGDEVYCGLMLKNLM